MIEGDPDRFAADLELARELLESGATLEAAVLCAAIGQRYRYDAIRGRSEGGSAIEGDAMRLGSMMLRAARAAVLGETDVALHSIAMARRHRHAHAGLRVIEGGREASEPGPRARLRLA